MDIDLETDLEPLCKLEDMLVRWLETLAIPWVQDPSKTTQRIYRGMENREVAQNASDQSVPIPEGDTSLSDEPSEPEESSKIELPCVMVSVDDGDCIGPDFVGNWEVKVLIEVASNSFDSTHKDHRSRSNDVLKLFMRPDLIDILRDFDADWDASKIVFEKLGKRNQGDTFVHELNLIFRHYTTRRID